MSKPQIEQTIERMQSEILADVAKGRVPATVKSFADLNDYVDANEYGGFTEDEVFDSLVAQFGGRDQHEGMPQGMLDFINVAQGRVNEWIAAGGVSSWIWLETLKLIERELSQHPEFARGNSKVHFAVHKARSAIALAT